MKKRSEADQAPVASATFGQLLLTAITRFADRPALGDGQIRWTYRGLGDAIARAMTVLTSLGLRKGDAIAMLAGNRPEQIACQYAGVLLGLRYTALHPLAAWQTHLFVLGDAEIDALLLDPRLDGVRAAEFRTGGLRHILSFGPLEGATDVCAAMAAAVPSPLRDHADPSDLLYVLYTGGTTGEPKGVMLSHRAFSSVCVLQTADWDLPEGAVRFLASTPTSHAAGAVLPTVFLRGGYVHLSRGFEPEDFCRTVAAEAINMAFLVPTMLYALLDHPALGRHDLGSLQTIMYGAAPMSADRLREGIAKFGSVFVQLYGQTEAPMTITTLRKSDHDLSQPERIASCGLPAPMVNVKLLDPELNEVPEGTPGEICVRGPIVMDGYWKRPETTREVFRGGWLHTGDIAIRSADGYFTIVDRTKDMIITGGFNVYPREVEDALLAHPDVSSAAVIGVPDDKWGEAVTAYVALKPGARPDEAALKAHVRALRGAIWSPKVVHFVDSIPVTSLGKVDRKALRARQV